MKCPVCNNPLKEFSAGAFKVDICDQGCSGIWFDKDELEKCDEYNESFPEELIRVKKVASVVIDRMKPRPCPRCDGVTLKHVSLDKDRNFSIDTCPTCSGHWLDIGELEKLRKDSKHMAEFHASQAAFEQKLKAELQDPATERRAMAFLKVLFK